MDHDDYLWLKLWFKMCAWEVNVRTFEKYQYFVLKNRSSGKLIFCPCLSSVSECSNPVRVIRFSSRPLMISPQVEVACRPIHRPWECPNQ